MVAKSKQVHREEEVDDLDEADEVIPFNFGITAYGADYPVDSLVQRILQNDVVVPKFNWPPEKVDEIVGFQREYVWPRKKADRFIESLLLGLPVPGIFLVKEPTGRLLVLDGHQRLHSLRSFYEGTIEGEEYALDDTVQERFRGLRYKDLTIEDKRRIDDAIIHATVIRQDDPSDDQSSIYMIFERLNTGGVNLQPQEIRVALYHGKLVSVLQKLNGNAAWRALYGNKSTRLKDLEMILRFFAFYYHAKDYRSPMKDFLNRYMAQNRNLKHQGESELGKVFEATADLLKKTIGNRAFRPERAINAAVIDSVMTGLARRIQAGKITQPKQIATKYAGLMKNRKYREAIETGTSQEAKVETRLRLATEAFASIK